MEGNYNGDYWADRAFPESYRQAFVRTSQLMAEHFNARGWQETIFQCYFNGKNHFKERGWSRSTCPWVLDEPMNFQDFWALRYYGSAFHEGVNRAGGKANMQFRCDISRPQWQRDVLDGVLDYNVVGGALRTYRRAVMDRKQANGQVVVEYGGTNAVEQPNVQPLGWCVDSWTLGTDGIEPWQTVGNDESWKKADTLSLFYPARAGTAGPVPSIRLKAYRRGEQDVEYLTLLAESLKEPRWALGQRMRAALHLAPVRKGAGFVGGEDAGLITFDRLLPQDVWALRWQVGQALSLAHVEARRQVVDFRTPRRDAISATSR